MKGLLLKDWYFALRYCRVHLGFVVFFSVVSLFIDLGMAYLFYPILFAGMIPVYILSAEEKSHWAQYAQTMPYSRRDVVKEKYILALISVCAALVLMFILWSARIALVGGSMKALFQMLVLLFTAGILFPALTLPPMFRFGVEKGRIFLIGFAVLASAIVVVYATSSINDEPGLLELIGGMGALNLPVLVVIAAALLALSFLLAARWYNKREL